MHREVDVVFGDLADRHLAVVVEPGADAVQHVRQRKRGKPEVEQEYVRRHDEAHRA